MNHLTQCLEQPIGFPCICDYLLEIMVEEEVEARIHEE
jgi:hypothetical protein